MTATIHYLRPFAREDLEKSTAEPAPENQNGEETEVMPGERPKRRRAMPCGRKSRFKKRMDGKVVLREKR